MNWDNFEAEREKLGRPFVIAHRGTPEREPENTLPSFAQAMEYGVDVLETDLRFTLDEEIVLIHDDTVDRTTNGQGAVSDYTLAELRQLRTHHPVHKTYVDEPIPTLIELMALTQGETPLLLELKDTRFADPRLAHKLIEMLHSYQMLDRVAFISFQSALVRSLKLAYPDITAGFVTFKDPRPPRAAELAGPFWPLMLLNPFYVKDVHARGGIVAPLDPTPLSRIPIYLALGVDALLANEPGEVLQALEARRS